jgi:hypothetical protein
MARSAVLSLYFQRMDPSASSRSRRYRNREHLRPVAQQACLVCGRKPTDPHHLGFTQPRALGRKVSDEFAVPCADWASGVFTCGITSAACRCRILGFNPKEGGN